MSVTRTSFAAAAVGATLALSAAPASAATVSVGGKCFAAWPSEAYAMPIPVQVGGLPPGATVRISLVADGDTLGSTQQLTADSTGAVITSLTSWTFGSADNKAVKGKTVSVVVSDFVNGTEFGAGQTKVTKVGSSVDLGNKRAGTKRSWKLSGLALITGNPGRSYYAHYFNSAGTKKVAKQKLGKFDECGYLSVKKPLAPFFKPGTYQLRVQAAQTFAPQDSWVGTKITLYRTFR